VIALMEGTVKVTEAWPDGTVFPLALRGAGEALGEMAVLLDRPRSATVTAASRCVGHVIAAHAFRGFLVRHRLQAALYQLTVDRMRDSERRRSELVHLPSVARLARLIDRLRDEVGVQQAGATLINLGMSRAELGVMAGMSRSTVVAALTELQALGAIKLGRRRIVVMAPVSCRRRWIRWGGATWPTL
jgi:CRP/FNR family transcriptional regulator, cyclic AMP receptor protein